MDELRAKRAAAQAVEEEVEHVVQQRDHVRNVGGQSRAIRDPLVVARPYSVLLQVHVIRQHVRQPEHQRGDRHGDQHDGELRLDGPPGRFAGAVTAEMQPAMAARASYVVDDERREEEDEDAGHDELSDAQHHHAPEIVAPPVGEHAEDASVRDRLEVDQPDRVEVERDRHERRQHDDHQRHPARRYAADLQRKGDGEEALNGDDDRDPRRHELEGVAQHVHRLADDARVVHGRQRDDRVPRARHSTEPARERPDQEEGIGDGQRHQVLAGGGATQRR